MGYFMAWAVIAVMLMTAANFKSTEKLAASFAYLILIAMVMANYNQLFMLVNGGRSSNLTHLPSSHIQQNTTGG